MVQCCVPGCVNSGPEYYKFPKEADVLEKWIDILKTFASELHYNSKESVVCSEHFLPEDYSENVLKKSSVPSIFNIDIINRKAEELVEHYIDSGIIHVMCPESELTQSLSNSSVTTSKNESEFIDMNLNDKNDLNLYDISLISDDSVDSLSSNAQHFQVLQSSPVQTMSIDKAEEKLDKTDDAEAEVEEIDDTKKQMAKTDDVCDCNNETCPGCFWACNLCPSKKCGPICRINRGWKYDKWIWQGRDDVDE